jgi:hypothetical protein
MKSIVEDGGGGRTQVLDMTSSKPGAPWAGVGAGPACLRAQNCKLVISQTLHLSTSHHELLAGNRIRDE